MATWVPLVVVAVLALGTAVPLGRHMAAVYRYEPTVADGAFSALDHLLYRAIGVDPDRGQSWTAYARSVLAFSLVSVVGLYGLLRLQGLLPLNPTGVGAVDPDLALNTAVSFASNTNWQNYAGETTLSHLTQMVGLTTQNVVSAAVGMAVLAALARGLAGTATRDPSRDPAGDPAPGPAGVGNFWADLVRTTTRVLLPLSVVLAVVLVTQGVVQTLSGPVEVTTVEGAVQHVAGGPVASQVAIKQLGSNGGGFFGANAAVPLENSTWLSNLLQTWAILAIPLALCVTFGRMVGRPRQGLLLLAVMVVLWGGVTAGIVANEVGGSPELAALGVDQTASADSPGGNMEGKEARFGPALSAIWAGATTGTSNGSVNAMHTSFTAAGGGLATWHMLLGEVSPGGVGVGLAGMLVLAVLAVFMAGLMVGRSPELLGKAVGVAEMKLVTLYLVAVPAAVLVATAATLVLPDAVAASANTPGPHGLTEILYGIASPANNNGSAFTGLAADTTWFNLLQSGLFVVGRWLLIVPVLALAGAMARRRAVPVTAGTLPTDTPTFGVLLFGTVVVLAGLTYFPALALGPIAEHLS